MTTDSASLLRKNAKTGLDKKSFFNIFNLSSQKQHKKSKDLQAFCVWKACDWPGLLMIPFEGQIGHGGRLDKALDLGAWGGSIQHILHAHPYHLLNHFFAATQILVGAINVNNIFVPTIYRCWTQRQEAKMDNTT